MDISYSHILATSPHEYFQGRYYVILAHLSTHFNDSVLIDLGTHKGESAAALSYNKSNIVYTYDIEHRAEAALRVEEEKNIRYILGDCIENDWSGMAMLEGVQPKSDKEIFLSSKLIFLDVDPHDGIQENKVLNFLINNNWKGVMVCDDIGMGLEAEKEDSHPQMREWWNSVELPKYNISANHYASGTGTGAICFDNQEVIF